MRSGVLAISYSCFVPCRKGSERVPKKNIKTFGFRGMSLVRHKIEQLIKANVFSEIVVSTDDEMVMEIVNEFFKHDVLLIERDPQLARSSTELVNLVKHAGDVCSHEWLLWTHVTSPFCTANIYQHAIKEMERNLHKGFDSLLSVQKMHEYFWYNGKPVNISKGGVKWPATQTLEPLFKINNAIFISKKSEYTKRYDRIGISPYLFEMTGVQSTDIDDPEDFDIAECLFKHM